MYPTLLVIEWDIYNHTIINFKKRILTFEYSEMRVVTPYDPLEGQRSVDLVNSEGQGDYMDHIYNITSTRDDYVNPTTDINFSWWSIISYTSDSGEALKNWQNQTHEVSMRKCRRITCFVQWVGIEESELPTYEGLPNRVSFLI